MALVALNLGFYYILYPNIYLQRKDVVLFLWLLIEYLVFLEDSLREAKIKVIGLINYIGK